jgi:hypothetical protein
MSVLCLESLHNGATGMGRRRTPNRGYSDRRHACDERPTPKQCPPIRLFSKGRSIQIRTGKRPSLESTWLVCRQLVELAGVGQAPKILDPWEPSQELRADRRTLRKGQAVSRIAPPQVGL